MLCRTPLLSTNSRPSASALWKRQPTAVAACRTATTKASGTSPKSSALLRSLDMAVSPVIDHGPLPPLHKTEDVREQTAGVAFAGGRSPLVRIRRSNTEHDRAEMGDVATRVTTDAHQRQTAGV